MEATMDKPVIANPDQRNALARMNMDKPASPPLPTKGQLTKELVVATAMPIVRESTSASPVRFCGHSHTGQRSAGIEPNVKPTGLTHEIITKPQPKLKGVTACPVGAPATSKR
jgi:hypothetical protein